MDIKGAAETVKVREGSRREGGNVLAIRLANFPLTGEKKNTKRRNMVYRHRRIGGVDMWIGNRTKADGKAMVVGIARTSLGSSSSPYCIV